MAKSFEASKELMTVRQVMKEIGARAPATVSRMIRSKKLRGEKIGAMGWLVYRDSVREFMQHEAARTKGVGFPRGQARTASKPPAKAAARKKPAATKKTSR